MARLPGEPDGESVEARAQRQTAETVAALTKLAREIDQTVHESVSVLAAITGSLQFLLAALRRVAERLERELDERDRREAPPDDRTPGE